MIGTGSLSGTRSAVFSFHVQFAYRCCFARFHLALPINTVSLTMKTCPLRLHRLGIIRHCDDAPLSIQAFEQFIDQMTYTVHTHTHKTVPVTCCSSQVLEVGRWPSPAPGVALPARPSRQATASHPSLSLSLSPKRKPLLGSANIEHCIMLSFEQFQERDSKSNSISFSFFRG